MSSRERDNIDRLFCELLQMYAEAHPPADAWPGIERRLRASARFRLDWRGWLARLSGVISVYQAPMIVPSSALDLVGSGGWGLSSPFISVMATPMFSLRSAAWAM